MKRQASKRAEDARRRAPEPLIEAESCRCRVRIVPRPGTVRRTEKPFSYQVQCHVAPARPPCIQAIVTITEHTVRSDGQPGPFSSYENAVDSSPTRVDETIELLPTQVGDVITVEVVLQSGGCLSEDSIRFTVV